MSIDWSKAPEGATHWEPTGPEFHEGWMKKEGNKWFYWGKGSEQWVSARHYCDVSAEREATFEERPQEPWNGQGLPPVGTVCEYLDANLEWYEVEIFGIDKAQRRIFASPWMTIPYMGCSAPECFRPSRTPEQIAAEERAKAIEEMCFAVETLTVKQAKALFGAGYRRQEEGK